MNSFLFKHIDNSALVVFRIFFGLLCFLESVGAIFTGWVNKTLIEPQFTFNFLGFDWLQPLPGNGMYVCYGIMGVFGLCIMLGYKYRLSAFGFALLWASTYFMQKTAYNNHYYLLFLLSFIMAILPANRYASLDVKLNPKLKSISMPNWCRWVFIVQLFIVYTYASIAKIYPDWLDTSVIKLLMQNKSNFPVVGQLLQNEGIHYFIAYSGILFDGLVIPLLLFKPTRKYAFFASIFFHLFNSFVFHIGIFPYLSLAFCLFFFEPETVRNIFMKKKKLYTKSEIKIPCYKSVFKSVFIVYFVIQIILPIRHYFIQDNVLWTEEGHRLSWRMMLRAKSGSISFRVVDNATNNLIPIKLNEYLTKKQQRSLRTKPDFIWQFSQILKKQFKSEGKDVSIFATCYVSVNGKPSKRFIDPEIDLAKAEWNYFKHNTWILPSK
ncbi:HTTM domain-containing protein [Winogradskyella sp.]|uniref:HTTM domain-containing protein n=1 Tax=Winogradskyella sp. TaxID=1883156 RepID=UPI0035C827DD